MINLCGVLREASWYVRNSEAWGIHAGGLREIGAGFPLLCVPEFALK